MYEKLTSLFPSLSDQQKVIYTSRSTRLEDEVVKEVLIASITYDDFASSPCRHHLMCSAGEDLLEAAFGSNFFDGFEVAYGLDLQFESGVFVADDHGVLVSLQRGERPHMV